MPGILLDTNILVYFYDHNSPEKQERAQSILERVIHEKTGFISAQNLSEFISVTLRKLKPPFTPAEALTEAYQLSAALRVIDLTGHIVLEAARGVRDYQLSYYDAQVWAAARLNQIPVVFTEDFQDGQVLETVQFANPFTKNFKLEDWI